MWVWMDVFWKRSMKKKAFVYNLKFLDAPVEKLILTEFLVSSNDWKHIAVRKSGTKISLFLNMLTVLEKCNYFVLLFLLQKIPLTTLVKNLRFHFGGENIIRLHWVIKQWQRTAVREFSEALQNFLESWSQIQSSVLSGFSLILTIPQQWEQTSLMKSKEQHPDILDLLLLCSSLPNPLFSSRDTCRRWLSSHLLHTWLQTRLRVRWPSPVVMSLGSDLKNEIADMSVWNEFSFIRWLWSVLQGRRGAQSRAAARPWFRWDASRVPSFRDPDPQLSLRTPNDFLCFSVTPL